MMKYYCSDLRPGPDPIDGDLPGGPLDVDGLDQQRLEPRRFQGPSPCNSTKKSTHGSTSVLSSFLAVISSSVWIIPDDRWDTGRGCQVPVGHVTASSVWIIPDDRWDTGGDHQIPVGHVTASAYIRGDKSREGILDVPADRGGCSFCQLPGNKPSAL